jgi:hypothetical protein
MERHVVGGGVEERRIVLELAEPAVAVEAQQGSDDTGLMVVVDVLGRGCIEVIRGGPADLLPRSSTP